MASVAVSLPKPSATNRDSTPISRRRGIGRQLPPRPGIQPPCIPRRLTTSQHPDSGGPINPRRNIMRLRRHSSLAATSSQRRNTTPSHPRSEPESISSHNRNRITRLPLNSPAPISHQPRNIMHSLRRSRDVACNLRRSITSSRRPRHRRALISRCRSRRAQQSAAIQPAAAVQSAAAIPVAIVRAQ